MPVSSYVVTLRSGGAAVFCGALGDNPDVLLGEACEGQLPVAVATKTEADARAWGERLDKMEGVESCTLVYHNFEDATESTAAETTSMKQL